MNTLNPLLPKYQQLAQEIRLQIINASLSAGAQLPTEEALMQTSGYSRDTVRKAMMVLETEGLIRKVQGLGSFVNSASPNSVPFRFVQPAAQGKRSFRVLKQAVLPASLEQAARLKVAPGCALIHIQQIELMNGKPFCFSERLLPQQLCPQCATADLTRQSAHDVLAQQAELAPMRATLEIEALRLSADEAALLLLPVGTPALRVLRMSYTAPNQPGVWYYAICCNHFAFEAELISPLQELCDETRGSCPNGHTIILQKLAD